MAAARRARAGCWIRVKVATRRRQGEAAWGPWGLPLPRQVGEALDGRGSGGTQLPARTEEDFGERM